MKPLNLDNSPCSPISSNCVIWQGPDLACIKLCKGDTVSDVVAKMATELCTILDQLNVDNYDLTCFNSTACPPVDFKALIQFLIEHICALENANVVTVTTINPPNTTSTTYPISYPQSNPCPDCVVSVAPCFIIGTQTTMQLTDYVTMIAEKLCDLIDTIATMQNQINNIDARVTVLENAPAPSFTLPTVFIDCTLSPTVVGGNSYQIDDILDAFINNLWCPFYTVVGSIADISSSLGSICVVASDTSVAFNEDTMTTAYSNWIDAPLTLAASVNNLWVALCDLRSGYSTYQFTDLGLPESVSFTVTPTPNIYGGQTYTVSGVTKPKENFFNQIVSTVQIKDDLVPSVDVYHFPTGYSTLTYTHPLGPGTPATFVVQVSYDVSTLFSGTSANNADIGNWVDGAIVKTVGVVDTVQYQSFAGRTFLSGYLFDGALVTDIVNTVSTDKVLTIPSGDPVEFRFSNGQLNNNISFMSVVTLNPGETISLKFKTKDNTTNSVLTQAQLLIQELIQN
jgi:hypothetical protein